MVPNFERLPDGGVLDFSRVVGRRQENDRIWLYVDGNELQLTDQSASVWYA